MKKLMVLFSFLLLLSACKDWQKDITLNQIHFEKYRQSKNGTRLGFMSSDEIIDGFPCKKGWIHFRDNWELLSFQISEDFRYQGLDLPSGTWIHFPYHKNQTGFICSFPTDITVQDCFCAGSGGYKGTHTGFYDNGKLRSFFPAEDQKVNGFPCKKSIFTNVNLYENGRMKKCKLAEDYDYKGKNYKKNMVIHLDKSGNVISDKEIKNGK